MKSKTDLCGIEGERLSLGNERRWKNIFDVFEPLEKFFTSVQFSRSVMSNSMWSHESQHTRPSCPSPTPGVHPNLCPWSRWCHPTISPSVISFSFGPQCFPASGSFQRSQLFTSFSFSISPSNEHPGLVSFRMDWLDLLTVQGTLRSLLQHHSLKASNSLVLSFLYSPTLISIHNHWKKT